jgi:uncharacterized protein involved in exopolysaccharide biosynthesis
MSRYGSSRHGRALTLFLFILPFSLGTSATVFFGLRAPVRYVSRMSIQRQNLMEPIDRSVERGDEELESLSAAREDFQMVARQLQSFKRIEEALAAVVDRSEDADDWGDRIEAVRRDVDVSFAGTSGTDGYVFLVRYRSPDSAFGPRFLHALGEQFLSKANGRRRNIAERQAARLETRIAAAKREISGLEEKLLQARSSTASVAGEPGDDDRVGVAADAASQEPSPTLEQSDLLRDLNLQKANYDELLSERQHLTDLQRKAAETPDFKMLSWPEERGEEVGKRFSGVALLAAAVGSVLGLIGALGSMLFQDARSGRARF